MVRGDLIEEVVNAVLYEGYILYPYRASSVKNQRERFTFGRVYPEAYSRAEGGTEPFEMRTECLVESERGAVDVTARFLQPIWREVFLFDQPALEISESELPKGRVVPELRVDDALYQSWQEARERQLMVGSIAIRNSKE